MTQEQGKSGEEIPTTPPSGELPMAPSPGPPEDTPSGEKPAAPLIEEEIPTTAQKGDSEEVVAPDLTEAIPEAEPESAPVEVPKKKARKRKRKKQHALSTCNVIDCTRDHQQFWRFSGGRSMKLVDVRDTEVDEPVPDKFTRRDASQMWSPHCQNDAWLPIDQVFLRVLQLPQCDPEELHEMVELQVEKNSPMPVSQAVWTYDVAPAVGERLDGQQTVVLIIADEVLVEDQVSQLEEIGYRPDRLEVPVLNQIFSTVKEEDGVDGAWIYVRILNGHPVCLVAWWSGGILRDINVTHLSSRSNLNELTEHLTASAWSAEMEGWLPVSPKWHLVADRELAERWLPVLNEWAGCGVQVHDPPESAALAAVSANRAARPLEEANLLPEEHRTRYHRDDVDRVWLAGAGWLVLFYSLFVAGYFYFLGNLRNDKEEAEKALKKSVRMLGPLEKEEQKFLKKKEYDNMRMKAAKCLETVAAVLPAGVTMEELRFNGGKEVVKNLTMNGVVPGTLEGEIDNFRKALLAVKDDKGASLFANVAFDNITDARAGQDFKRWFINCELEIDRTKHEPKKKKRR